MKKIIQAVLVLVIATMLLANPVFAEESATSTQTSSQDSIIQQLLQQVADLTKQIAEMQVQLTKLIAQKKEVVEQKDVIIVFTRPMYLGVIGDDVVLLQEFLATDSGIYPEGLVTGYYGALTKKAVKRLQEKFGLEIVGIVGPKTREKINMEFQKKDGDDEVPEWITKKDEYKKEVVSTISNITLTVEQDTEKVRWESDGVSPRGFKLTWSKNPNPTYPTRDGDKYAYLSSPDAEYYKLEAFDGDGEYYVRVCEYLGGKCGVYSNEIQITLSK